VSTPSDAIFEADGAGPGSERALALALAAELGHPVVILGESTLDLHALELMPRAIAERHTMLPVAIDGDTITLAVTEVPAPGSPRPPVFDQVEFATGRRVQLLLAVPEVLAETIAAAYESQHIGEHTLVGAEPRPPEAPHDSALSIARATALPDDEDFLSAPAEPPPAAVLTPSAAATRPQIFVIDDEEDIRTLLRKVLSYDGYDVVEARTGREALELLRTLRPAAILVDAMLPEIHGFDICATLKKSEAFAATPVVVISAVYKGWENARTVQEVHGADAFVEKPFDVHYLRQLVARLVGKELPKNQLGPDWQKKVKELREEAQVAWRLNDIPGLEDAIKRWRALDPFDAHAWLYLGNARTRAGDLEGAMKAYERAATFDGTLFQAFKNLAVVYEQLGFAQRSLMSWSRAYELAPDAEARRRIEERLARRGGGG
jgi:CheY-like chemotaxis protein